MPTIKLNTPAKINLLLSVLKKGLDNYHEIETVFQAVNLFDFITVDYRATGDTKIRIMSNSQDMPLDSSNLAWKAADLFLKTVNLKAEVKILIQKNIPIAAGLAGGSSDAACVLKALNKINNYPLDEERMKQLCTSLGADVVFFMEGGTAMGKGIGDVIKPVSTPDLNIVLIKPKNLVIKSGWAYEKYDQLTIKPPPKKLNEMIIAINDNNVEGIAKNLFNSLEYAVFKEYPELRKYKEHLIKQGCHNAMLSGSGPTLFGIARDKEHARQVKEFFDSPELDCYVVETISCSLNVN